MKIELSKKLILAYKEYGKNPNYSLTFLLNSLDPYICVAVIQLPDIFSFNGNTMTCEVDDENACIIQKLFGRVDSVLLERLLWVALLFPEV